MSFSLLCGRVLPKTPEGSRTSRIKEILFSVFSKRLISEGRVFPINRASDLAVKMKVWILFPNCIKEALPWQKEYSNTKGSAFLSNEQFAHKKRRVSIRWVLENQ